MSKLSVNVIKHSSPAIAPITDAYDERVFADLAKLPNVTLVEQRDFEEDKRERKDCIWYVNQKLDTETKGAYSFGRWQPKGYVLASKLRVGSPIVYHWCPRGNGENHIGIYLGDDRVESKFGYGHVYRHDINSVPQNYGPYYYACIPALGEDRETTLENMESWFALYEDIISLRVEFVRGDFPNSTHLAVTKELEALGLVRKSEGGRLRGEEAEHVYYAIYQVPDNFLDQKAHRDQVRAIYESHRRKNA